MQTPKVTFIIASYNYHEYLTETLGSLTRQWSFSHPFEIVIVEDGSTDGSLEIAQEFSNTNKFVRLVTHSNHANKGLSASLRLALQHVSTEWVAFLESDDVSKPETVETLLKVLNTTSAGLIFFDIEPLLENGATKGWFDAYVPRIRDCILKKWPDGHCNSMDFEILKENFIPTFSCAVVKKHLLEECSFNCPVAAWIDWFLWAQIIQKTNVLFLNKKLVSWRIHRTSQNHKKNLKKYIKQYKIFRLAVKKRLSEMDVEDKFSKILLLSLPVIIPLGVRFLKMARYLGFRKVIKQIYGRLKNE